MAPPPPPPRAQAGAKTWPPPPLSPRRRHLHRTRRAPRRSPLPCGAYPHRLPPRPPPAHCRAPLHLPRTAAVSTLRSCGTCAHPAAAAHKCELESSSTTRPGVAASHGAGPDASQPRTPAGLGPARDGRDALSTPTLAVRVGSRAMDQRGGVAGFILRPFLATAIETPPPPPAVCGMVEGPLSAARSAQ